MKNKNKIFYALYEIIRNEQGETIQENNVNDFDNLQQLANYLQKPIGTIKAANKRHSLIDSGLYFKKYMIYRFTED